MSPVEALTQIRALCDEIDRDAEADPNGGFGPGMQAAVREVRAVLDAVSVDATPAQDIDLIPGTREAAHALAAFRAQASRLRHDPYYGGRFDSDADALDALAARLEASS